MNPEAKTLWLEALRSGRYEQGTGYLNQGKKFCCLGVLCELAIQQGVDLKVRHIGDEDDSRVSYGEEGNESTLPIEARRWSGVDALGSIIGATTLSALNDNGKTFTEIADLIEKYL